MPTLCKFCGIPITYDRSKEKFMDVLLAHWAKDHPDKYATLQKGFDKLGGREKFEGMVDQSIKQFFKNKGAQHPGGN